MIICYARSSSLKDIEYCEQKYFINYNLGIKEPANKKAVMGTIAHKVLEWLALCKLNDSEQIKFFDDSLNEEMSFNRELLYSPTILTEETVKQINKTRANKDIYKSSCLLEGQVTRLGYETVNDMVIKSFNYYSAKYPYDWTVSDLKNCGNWVWMALEWNNGHYDPRNLKILSPEQQFDMKVDKEWATYDYDIGGEKISGNFAIKGTVDLITELDSDTIEIIDWKTGQRKNWATGQDKTYEDLCSDIQLALYHYAVSRLYPSYKHVLLTIFFVRDGGPFTVTFDTDNVENVETTLKNHFEYIKNNKIPKLRSPTQSDFQCKKLCGFYKQNWPGSEQNICRFIHNEIKRVGIDNVINMYKQKDHYFAKYQNPGE